jgi:hypothetical protein
MLVFQDGSTHDWFSGRRTPCDLIVTLDMRRVEGAFLRPGAPFPGRLARKRRSKANPANIVTAALHPCRKSQDGKLSLSAGGQHADYFRHTTTSASSCA